MTPAKALPPHGTYARSVGRPDGGVPMCRCEPCAAAARAYNQRRYLLNATGRTLTVPPDRAARHVRYLLGNGASWNTLNSAGCHNATTRALLNGEYPRIHRRTEQKILAIRLHDVVAPFHPMPALGAARRIQALIAVGYQVQQLAEHVGADQSRIREVLNGRVDTVTVQFDRKIAAAYDRLCMTVGTCERARRRAQLAGWPPPLAWDDIDDPSAVPCAAPDPSESPLIDEVALRRIARGDRTVLLHGAEKPIAARELAAQGLSTTAIATALHVHSRSVLAWLTEAA